MTEHESTGPVPATAWIYPTVIHGVLGLTLFTRLLGGGQSFRKLFREFNMRLPALTESFLALSGWLADRAAVALAVLAALWVLDGVILWMLGGWARADGRLYFFAGVAVLVITWLVLEVSFFLPYWKLREALSR